MVTPRTMPGVLELLPGEQAIFQRMVDTIRRVYERFGFVSIETPVIELTDVLLTKTGGETERQVYFVQSTGSLAQGGEPELALRFDLTVPLARYVAEHQNDLAFPFRRYQIQPVYRGESPQRGRFREFYQCDIDVIGRDSLSVRYDAEMPAVIEQVFEELGIGPFTIRINNRKLMRGLLGDLGVEEAGLQSEVLREVDKLEKRGPDAVASSMAALGLGSDTVSRLLEIISIRAEGAAALDRLAELPEGGPLTTEGIDELRTVFETMGALGVSEDHYALDVSIARGLDYYTGTVYETTLDDHPGVGSICSGGRYDDLAGMYTSARLPGVGISIGLTRLFWQLRELGLLPEPGAQMATYVTLMDPAGLEYAFGVAAELRAAGIATETAVEPGKLGKQLKYADRRGARYAVISGDEERRRRTVTIKDLVEQSQEEVPRAEAASYILGRQG